MADAPRSIAAARWSAFAAAVQSHGDSLAALVARAPALADAVTVHAQVPALRTQLTAELSRLEAALLPSVPSAVDEAIDDATFYVRRRRVDFVRRRAAAIRALPSALRKFATMSADECGTVLDDLGATALARAMKSVRPSELPAALQRLGPDVGRRVIQRVIADPADWPNDLRRLVRAAYLAAAPEASSTAVLRSLGQAVIRVVADRLTDADRAALHAASVCDLRPILSPPDAAWRPFVEPLRLLVRERLSTPAGKETR